MATTPSAMPDPFMPKVIIPVLGEWRNVGNMSTLRWRSPASGAHPHDIISHTQAPAAPGAAATVQGLRRLGSAEISSAGPKGPGEALPLAIAVASGNPIELIVSRAVNVGGQVSGSSTVEGSAKRTAREIAEHLMAARKQGRI